MLLEYHPNSEDIVWIVFTNSKDKEGLLITNINGIRSEYTISRQAAHRYWSIVNKQILDGLINNEVSTNKSRLFIRRV